MTYGNHAENDSFGSQPYTKSSYFQLICLFSFSRRTRWHILLCSCLVIQAKEISVVLWPVSCEVSVAEVPGVIDKGVRHDSGSKTEWNTQIPAVADSEKQVNLHNSATQCKWKLEEKTWPQFDTLLLGARVFAASTHYQHQQCRSNSSSCQRQ